MAQPQSFGRQRNVPQCTSNSDHCLVVRSLWLSFSFSAVLSALCVLHLFNLLSDSCISTLWLTTRIPHSQNHLSLLSPHVPSAMALKLLTACLSSFTLHFILRCVTEPADLGAFTTVFRVMNQFQQQQQTVLVPPRSDSRITNSNSENESDVGETSTVWSQRPIASYLERDDTGESTRSISTSNSPEVLSEEEEERGSESSDTEGLFEDDVDGLTPSLGDLDSALGFLAAEKAKLSASHLDGRSTSHSSTGESAWRHVVEPKRKRRRKRKGALSILRTLEHDEDIPAGARTATVVPTPEASSSSPDLSSSPDKTGTSPPQHDSAPAISKPRRPKARLLSHPQSPQHIPSSSPSITSRPVPIQPDPRLLRLRSLAKKLRHDFPQNESQLKQVLVDDFPENDLIDPRASEPLIGDALIHVFVDQWVHLYVHDVSPNSNILQFEHSHRISKSRKAVP